MSRKIHYPFNKKKPGPDSSRSKSGKFLWIKFPYSRVSSNLRPFLCLACFTILISGLINRATARIPESGDKAIIIGVGSEQREDSPINEFKIKNKTVSKKGDGKIASYKSSSLLKRSGVANCREITTILRLKREYRDAVQMGIAYDWISRKRIVSAVKVSSCDKPSAAKDNLDIIPLQSSNKTLLANHNDLAQFRTTNNVEVMHDLKSPCTNRSASTERHILLGPLGTNLRVWHFSVRGPTGTRSPYAKGIYHGRVVLPKDYPGSPPRVHILTPNGRFIPGVDICLSASSYHPESWSPQWTIQGLIHSLRLHFLTEPNEIGGMNASPNQKRFLAVKSRSWIWQIPSTTKQYQPVIIDHSSMLSSGDFGSDVEDYPVLSRNLEKRIEFESSIKNQGADNEETVVTESPLTDPLLKSVASDENLTEQPLSYSRQSTTKKTKMRQIHPSSTRNTSAGDKKTQLDDYESLLQFPSKADVYRGHVMAILKAKNLTKSRRKQVMVRAAIKLLRILSIVMLMKLVISFP